MTYRILISVVSFLFVYLPSKSGFVILKPFATPYSVVTWAISSNSSSCSEIVTELSRPVYQSHTNSAQNSVYQSLQALLQILVTARTASTFRATTVTLGHPMQNRDPIYFMQLHIHVLLPKLAYFKPVIPFNAIWARSQTPSYNAEERSNN